MQAGKGDSQRCAFSAITRTGEPVNAAFTGTQAAISVQIGTAEHRLIIDESGNIR